MELRRSRARPRLLWFLAWRGLFGGRATLGLLVVAVDAGAGFQIRYVAERPIFAWERFAVRPVVAAGTFALPALVIAATAIAALRRIE